MMYSMEETVLRAIHERLLNGDPTAQLDLFEHASPALVRKLAKTYFVDETWIIDAVTDTLFELMRNPRRYQPDLGPLSAYLRMSAKGDLKNRLAREKKQLKSLSLEAVAVSRDKGNTPLAERIADPTVDPDRWVEEIDPVLLETIRRALPSETDRRILALMARGERSTHKFAEVLGISHLSPDEQRRLVKQAKDRIVVRVKRALRRRGRRYGT